MPICIDARLHHLDRVDEEVPESLGVLYKEREIGDFERRFTR